MDNTESPLAEDNASVATSSWRYLKLLAPWRFRLSTLMVLVTLTAISVWYINRSYEYAIVDRWTQSVLPGSSNKSFATGTANRTTGNVPGSRGTGATAPIRQWGQFSSAGQNWKRMAPCSDGVSDERQLALVLKYFESLPTEQKAVACKIISELYPEQRDKIFDQWIETTNDSVIRSNLIRLTAYHQDPDTSPDISFYRSTLTSSDPLDRWAAIDALRILLINEKLNKPDLLSPFPYSWPTPGEHLHFITYDVDQSSDYGTSTMYVTKQMDCPPIATPINRDVTSYRDLRRQLTETLAPKLIEIAATDSAPQAMEAARRFLIMKDVANQPFRFAEWGVWIDDHGKLEFAQSVIDEIPSFVHRFPDKISTLESERTPQLMLITKPIIHLTVNRPLVCMIGVTIQSGRPWFAYPMPNDYFAGSRMLSNSIPLKSLAKDLSKNELFPVYHNDDLWRSDRLDHMIPIISSPSQWPGWTQKNSIGSLGLVWDSVMVMPEKPDSWKLENVTDSKHKWWSDLRDVPSSWINNRGQTERFLYYDGPTHLATPYQLTWSIERDSREVEVSIREFENEHLLSGGSWLMQRNWDWLYIEVVGGNPQACHFKTKLKDNETQRNSVEQLPITGDAVFEKVVSLAMERGLNREEAVGLARCWKPQFCDKDGKRLLCFMDKRDYTKFCPVVVYPAPTEMARCGIILTELEAE